MEQETHFNEHGGESDSSHNQEGFDYQSLSPEEQVRLVTLTSGKKVILAHEENPSKAFDPETGELIDVSPDDIIERRA